MNSPSKRVFHVMAQLRLGAGRFVADTAIEQALNLGHHVTVCVSTDTDENWRTDPALVAELVHHGIEVRSLGDFFHRRADLLHEAGARLRDFMGKRSMPVVVHAHTAMAAAVGHWAKPDALVATCHGWGIGRPAEFDLQDSLAYQVCDSVITYSRYWLDRLNSDLAAPNVSMVLMGLNLERFPRLADAAPLSGPERLVTVCELTPRKGVDLLLKAMPAVWISDPGVELHIIGHGEAAGDLRHLASEVDPGMQRIVFHGAMQTPYLHLADFDLFVLASRSDNLPVALLEAMFARLPIVATEVGGVSDLLSSAGCGRIVPPESYAAFSAGILAMLQLGRKKMRQLGIKGEHFSRRQFNVRSTAVALERVYRAALGKAAKRKR